MKSTLAPSTIFAGFLRHVVWIRIECKGSVDCSHDLRQFIELMVSQGRPKMVIDLDHCPGMDSTFMGTLAGIALRLRQVPGGSLDILNPGERNLQSLRELGLDHILSVDCTGTLWLSERQMMNDATSEPVQVPPADEKARHATMTEAHETLCQVNSENIPRFRDVLELLKESRPE
jgi:anti-anti-sigma regulatory factor